MKIRTKLVIISTSLYFLLLSSYSLYIIFDTKFTYEELAYKRNLSYINIIDEFLYEHYNEEVMIDSALTSLLPNDIEKIYYQIYENDILIAEDGDMFEVAQYKLHLRNKEKYEVFDVNEENHYFLAVKDVKINNIPYTIAVAIRAFELELEFYGVKIIYLLLFLLVIPVVAVFELYLSRAAFNPIRRIIKNVKEITATNLHKRLEIDKPKDEIRELSETLNMMIDRLEKSFESQKRFIADASHEIKTPLTIIRAELELLNEDAKENDKIDKLLVEVDRLTELSKALLMLAKLDANRELTNIKTFRVDELIVEVVQIFNSAAYKRDIDIVLNIDEIAEINGDEEKLKSVFYNLLDNAIKYSPDNSTIKIALSVEKNNVAIIFEDNGYGINKDEQIKVLERFYRSNEHRASVNGSGLGLAIVKEIVDLHNGSILLTSKKGIGTKVTIKFPFIDN